MRLLVLIAGALVISAFGAWLINPGLFISASADTAGYAERKSTNETTGTAALTARPLSIEDAYRLVPHPRTPFRPDLAQMPAAEADYLQALFRVTDRGVVERVFIQSQLDQGSDRARQSSNYDPLLEQLRSLPTPEKLLPIEALVFEAVQEQRDYLGDWEEAASPRFFSPHAGLVQSSHKKLIGAYKMLIDLYGSEPRHNKQAFFDHLCALDFI